MSYIHRRLDLYGRGAVAKKQRRPGTASLSGSALALRGTSTLMPAAPKFDGAFHRFNSEVHRGPIGVHVAEGLAYSG